MHLIFKFDNEHKTMNLLNIFIENKNESWFPEIQEYLSSRRQSIIERYEETFRYVSPEPKNKNAYSYEYASILRDVCSVFDSVLKETISQKGLSYSRMPGHMQFLKTYEQNLNYFHMQFLNNQTSLLYPFEPDTDGLPYWWNAGNKVKHNEGKNKEKGSFEHATNALAALTILKAAYNAGGPGNSIFTIIRMDITNTNYVNKFF